MSLTMIIVDAWGRLYEKLFDITYMYMQGYTSNKHAITCYIPIPQLVNIFPDITNCLCVFHFQNIGLEKVTANTVCHMHTELLQICIHGYTFSEHKALPWLGGV